MDIMELNEMISAKLTIIKGKLDIFPYVNDAVVLGALIGLSYIGIALTRVSAHTAYLYWVVMIPLFGAISLLAQWQVVRADSQTWSLHLRRQLFHWIGLWVAVHLTYMLLGVGLLHYESVGFVVFLLLAFAFFLQGVYVDWRFYIVGGVPRREPPGGHVSRRLSMDHLALGHRVHGRWGVVHQNQRSAPEGST